MVQKWEPAKGATTLPDGAYKYQNTCNKEKIKVPDDMLNANNLRDTLTINLKMENGSIAAISYFSNGSKELAKEHLEIFTNGQSIVINDFKTMSIYGKSTKTINLSNQDKGHKEEVTVFLEAIKKGQPCPIPFNETYNAMLATFKVEESIAKNGAQIII